MLPRFAFPVYVTLGGFLTWRRPRTFWIHLGRALYGLSISVVDWIRPLTHVENWGRERAGQSGLTGEGFIDTYRTGVIHPADHLITVQTGVGVLVVLSWIGVAQLTRRRRHHTSQNRT